jgi:hypothetical protein
MPRRASHEAATRRGSASTKSAVAQSPDPRRRSPLTWSLPPQPQMYSSPGVTAKGVQRVKYDISISYHSVTTLVKTKHHKHKHKQGDERENRRTSTVGPGIELEVAAVAVLGAEAGEGLVPDSFQCGEHQGGGLHPLYGQIEPEPVFHRHACGEEKEDSGFSGTGTKQAGSGVRAKTKSFSPDQGPRQMMTCSVAITPCCFVRTPVMPEDDRTIPSAVSMITSTAGSPCSCLELAASRSFTVKSLGVTCSSNV